METITYYPQFDKPRRLQSHLADCDGTGLARKPSVSLSPLRDRHLYGLSAILIQRIQRDDGFDRGGLDALHCLRLRVLCAVRWNAQRPGSLSRSKRARLRSRPQR